MTEQPGQAGRPPEQTQGGYGEPATEQVAAGSAGWGGYGQPAYGQSGYGGGQPGGYGGGQPGGYGNSQPGGYGVTPSSAGYGGSPYGQPPYAQQQGWGPPAYGQGSPYSGATRSSAPRGGLSTPEGAGRLLVVLGYAVAALGVIAAIAALTVTSVGGGYVVESFCRDLLLGVGVGGLCLGLGQLLKSRAAATARDGADAASGAGAGGTGS